MLKHAVSVLLSIVAVVAIAAPAPAAVEPEPPAGSGCCSHHQGVCGCSAGRAVCCDGVTSPSCGC